ncbi:PA24B phospholipase, partial [Burhinus bistriatus]|nr:PA24B phospholipase [Burhinus bistriatus]
DVRFGYDLCREEQEFLQKRKRVVASALKRVLHLERDLHGHEVPVIAVMATGGGLRAMSAMFGHLLALQKLNLLDCVTYLTGASGSTWCVLKMTCVFGMTVTLHFHTVREMHLFQSLTLLISECNSLVKLLLLAFDHNFSLGLLILFLDESGWVNIYKLTDQRKALEHGQNPLPFYAVLNVKEEKFSTFQFREWAEFSPYEVAIPKYGASIRSEYFDSEFFMGRRVKKLPESRICYLEGLWTNIFTRNLLDGLYWSSNSNEFWERWAKDM